MAAPSAPTSPRFSPGERPRAAIAADGTLAAIIESQRVVVLELPGGEPFAEVGVDPVATTNEVAWVGVPPRLLVLSRYAEHARVHLVDPHGPRALADLRIETPMRLAATCGAHALLVSPQSALIVTAADSHLVSVPYPSRVVPSHAGTAGTNFLVAHADSVEEWDPQARMPKRRLKLPRAATITTLGGSDRVVWMTTQQEPARLDVLALVDRGQPKAHDLPEPIAFATGHPRSDLVVCIGESGKLYIVDLDGRSKLKTVTVDGIDQVQAAGLVVGRIVGVLAAAADHPVAIVTLEGHDPEVEVAVPRTMTPTGSRSTGASGAGSGAASGAVSGAASGAVSGAASGAGGAGARASNASASSASESVPSGSDAGRPGAGRSSAGRSGAGGPGASGGASGSDTSGSDTSGSDAGGSGAGGTGASGAVGSDAGRSGAGRSSAGGSGVSGASGSDTSGSDAGRWSAGGSGASGASGSAAGRSGAGGAGASGAVPAAIDAGGSSGSARSAGEAPVERKKPPPPPPGRSGNTMPPPVGGAARSGSTVPPPVGGVARSGSTVPPPMTGSHAMGAAVPPPMTGSTHATGAAVPPPMSGSTHATGAAVLPPMTGSTHATGAAVPSSSMPASASSTGVSSASSAPPAVAPGSSSLARPATRAFARAPTPHPRAASEGVDVDLEGVFDELSSEAHAYNDRAPALGTSEQFDSPLAFEARPVADHAEPADGSGTAGAGGGRGVSEPRPVGTTPDARTEARADARTEARADARSETRADARTAATTTVEEAPSPRDAIPAVAAIETAEHADTSGDDDDDEDLAPPMVRDAGPIRAPARDAGAMRARESSPALRDPQPRKPRQVTLRQGPALPVVKPAWRDEVVFWTYEVFDGVVERGAPIASPLDDLAARFGVPDSILPALVVLYGAHLAGERGVAPVHIARVLGSWDEALGRGLLAGRGLATFADSRVRLAGPIQRFLDEVAVTTGAIVGVPGTIALPGPHAVIAKEETPLKMVAVRWLAEVGGGILAAHDDADLAELFVEARARGAAPMFRIGADELLELGTDPAILVVTDEEVAESLGVPRLG
ncbi:MAG: hypothetical protein AB7T06_18350 [Kofleriaceae bacterium]